MHSLTLHRSGINETKQFRLSLDCRSSSSLKTINEEQLLPPYHPHVPEWEALSKKWKNPGRFEIPSTIQVHQKDKELDRDLKKEEYEDNKIKLKKPLHFPKQKQTEI